MLISRALPRSRSLWRTAICGLLCALITLLAGCGAGSSATSSVSGGGTSTAHGQPVWQPPANPPQLQPVPAGDWPRFGFDPARTGVNSNENAITPTNVDTLHRLWQATLASSADSSPALLQNVRLSDGSTRTLLYLTTLQGALVALDTANGQQVWAQQTHGPKITNSSPVVNPATSTVYAYGLDGALHQYDAATGNERTGNGWPAPVTTFPQTEKESSALNIAQGYVYATTSGYIGDAVPYQGHIVVITEQNANEHIFNSLCAGIAHLLTAHECSAQRSGIWARAGVVVDPVTGNIFATTGNGPFDPTSGNYGDTVLELTSDGSHLIDSFTPTNYQQLNNRDQDLGSTAPAMLPKVSASTVPYLALQGGKDSKLRLLNRQNLSGTGHSGAVGGAVEVIQSPVCSVFTVPVVTTHQGSDWAFVAGTCGLAAFTITLDSNHQPHLRKVWQENTNVTSPVLANGVLYAAKSNEVSARDPWTGKMLWNSTQGGSGGNIGGIHWQSPIVAGGALYISDENQHVTAYGLP